MSEMNSTALYLLGFADLNSLAASYHKSVSEANPSLPGPFAVQQQLLAQLRIEYLRVGDMLAWYKIIDKSEFASETAASNLSDLNWLTPRVLAHEAIVSKLSEYFAFYPARFGCVFSNRERLTEFVRYHTQVLHQFFKKVAGRKEWGVKLIGDVDATSQALALRSLRGDAVKGDTVSVDAVSMDALRGDALSGSNYLKSKQLTRQLRGEALVQLEQLSQQALNDLEATFPMLVVRTLGIRNNPDRERVFVSVALLLNDAESEAMDQWCEQWNSRKTIGMSLQMRVTGPWPPYSFCPSLADVPQRPAAEDDAA